MQPCSADPAFKVCCFEGGSCCTEDSKLQSLCATRVAERKSKKANKILVWLGMLSNGVALISRSLGCAFFLSTKSSAQLLITPCEYH